MVPKTSLVFYLIYLTFVLICNQHYYSKESREPLCYSHVLILYLNTAIHTQGQLRKLFVDITLKYLSSIESRNL